MDYDNFAGVRIDGSNATIVGRQPGGFKFDPTVGGYRLNTDFGEVMLTLGRAFGFAFGHKENGTMFSHMAVLKITCIASTSC